MSEQVLPSTARERSGKAPKATPDPVVVSIALGDGDTEAVTLDPAGLTFRERHDMTRALARLIERDDDGRVIVGVDDSDRALAMAWVVLRRSRPDLKFSDLWDNVKVSGLDVQSPDVEALEVDDPEG